MKFSPKEIRDTILSIQKIEITEHHIYKKLAGRSNEKNRKILDHIADDELRHYTIWKKYTGKEIKPSKFKMYFYYLISLIFGLTFGLKLMEKWEKRAQINYDELSSYVPEAKKIGKEEHQHEIKLIDLLKEEKLEYVGSIVLGLNDALIELTGALAGLTLALQNTKLVAIAGFIAGTAASMSMAASEYLSTKSEASQVKYVRKNPLKAAIYTGIAYLFTVLFLIYPYLIVGNIYLSLLWALANAIFVIFIFSFYVSIAQGKNFRKGFGEMVILSLGIATISFGIGYLVRIFFGIKI